MKKQKRIGKVGYWISKIIYKTMKVKIEKSSNYNENENYVYAFWHDTIYLPMVNMTKNGGKIANLVSPSKDGQIIATMLENYGYKIIRGSSNKNNVRSLIQLIREIKKNSYSGGFAVDGPRGPRHKSKAGVVYTAQKSGKAIIPLGGAFSKKWIFEKAWDKLQFPKPFSKAFYIIGEPIIVPKDADVAEYQEKLDNILNELNKKAEEKLIILLK